MLALDEPLDLLARDQRTKVTVPSGISEMWSYLSFVNFTSKSK